MIDPVCKMKEQMKAIQSEIKEKGTNSEGKETGTQINDLEQKEEINIQLEQNEERRIWKIEERLRNHWDNLKHSNIRIMGVPDGEQQQEVENLFEQIMKEIFPNLAKEIRLLGNPGSSESIKEIGPKVDHIIIILPKINDKEGILKAAREKDSCLQRSTHKAMLISQRKPCRQEGAEKKY